MYQSTPQTQASRKARRNGRGLSEHAGESTAQMSGANPNHANTERHGGNGPASGNGNSSNPAESPAAAHKHHCGTSRLRKKGSSEFGCIQP